jgi:hypothetical protein
MFDMLFCWYGFFPSESKVVWFSCKNGITMWKKIRFPTKTVSKLSVHQDSKKVNFLLSPSLIFLTFLLLQYKFVKDSFKQNKNGNTT